MTVILRKLAGFQAVHETCIASPGWRFLEIGTAFGTRHPDFRTLARLTGQLRRTARST